MKHLYRKLCENEPSIPLFSQAWWLDAAAGDDWDVVIVTKKGQVIGALPYVVRKKWGFRMLTQPRLTQALGPWVRPSQKSYPKQLAYEKDVLGQLADQLPSCDYYAQSWHCERQNWLPFYWRGFEQTTRYTYRLSLEGGEEHLWEGLQENTRREIRKAKGRMGIVVREATLGEFLDLNRLTFHRQNRPVPYTEQFVKALDAVASERNARDCLVAADAEGRLHAGAYIVCNDCTAYYLMGGGDPELRNSGATSLVLWEAIRRQLETVTVFDFEGSMIESIERFFRAFGAIQTPYFHVSRSDSKLFKLLKNLHSLRS